MDQARYRSACHGCNCRNAQRFTHQMAYRAANRTFIREHLQILELHYGKGKRWYNDLHVLIEKSTIFFPWTSKYFPNLNEGPEAVFVWSCVSKTALTCGLLLLQLLLWVVYWSGWSPSIDYSNETVLQKLQLLLRKSTSGTRWVIPSPDEKIEFQDKYSFSNLLGIVEMKVLSVLQTYLHWKFDSVACYFCVVSFVLFRGIWLKKHVGHILPFVSQARLSNFLRQSESIYAIVRSSSSWCNWRA